jgi:formylglycine-generating enzyme required for sulfatase activity
MEAALKSLGFQVDLVINGSLRQMLDGVDRFRRKLSAEPSSYGFFYYAGHGVQSGGANYLIPVNARVESEADLPYETLVVQRVLDHIQEAENALNVIILDACRDNPFSWKRSGTRGLVVERGQPPGSIIVYATSAGSTAEDGAGRNGLFTTHLLKNLKTPGLSFNDIFNKTGEDVRQASGNKQIPAIYSQFFKAAYPGPELSVTPPPPVVHAGSVQVSSEVAGVIIIDGKDTGVRVKSGGSAVIHNVSTGDTTVGLRGDDGKVINAPNVRVVAGQTAAAQVKQPAPAPKPVAVQPAPAPAPKPASASIPSNFVLIRGGTFTMGSPSSEKDRYDREGPQHQVTVRSFYMSKYEVTQKEWQEVMGTTVRQQRDKANTSWPLVGEGDSYPMYYVSWYEAIEYCNKRSQREGLTPAYTIDKSRNDPNNKAPTSGEKSWEYDPVRWTVTWNRNANGYRLPTEAEWEYACRAGTTTPYYTGSSVDNAGWYYGNSGNKTHPVGQKQANAWGLYDMHGNVWEWCWDWYGSYSGGSQTDPVGASSGTIRVWRGGSWYDSAGDARSALRNLITPSLRSGSLGFRLLRPSL